MIVSFKKVQLLSQQDASPIRAGDDALGPTTGTDPSRPTLYDPTWGYFTFGQSTTFDYGDGNDYQDVTTIRISGCYPC